MLKISENPTSKKLSDDVKSMKTAVNVMSLLGLFNGGIKDTAKDLKSKVSSIESQLADSMNIPDEFNKFLSEDGWIAYETMNLDVMKKVVKFCAASDFESAKTSLIEYYSPANIRKIKFMLNWTEPAKLRFDLIENALKDYTDKNYISCIPQLLMIMDGIVNDVNKKGGFAAQNIDMEVWDSIAGHSSSLNTIKQIITRSRKKTTTEPIYLPYRNGILHGRDLNYGNLELAAKCWGILFAISAWGQAYYSEEKRKEKFNNEVNLQHKPFLETLREYSEHKTKMDNFDKMRKEWKPRNIIVGTDVIESGISSQYIKGSPEKTAVEFLEFLNAKNYGFMFRTMHRGYTGFDSDKAQIGAIREDFKKISVASFRITKVEDCAPAISEVYFNAEVVNGNQSISIDFKLRLIYSNGEDAVIYGFQDGDWKIVSGYNQILYARE